MDDDFLNIRLIFFNNFFLDSIVLLAYFFEGLLDPGNFLWSHDVDHPQSIKKYKTQWK